MIGIGPRLIYPDFYGVHPDFCRVPPRPNFFRVLTFFLIYKYETELFSSCQPEKTQAEATLKYFQTAP